MPDEDKTAEAALWEDLYRYYDNPASFYDADLPLTHNLRIVNESDPQRRPVVKVEIDGLNLTTHLRTYLLNHIKHFDEAGLIRHFDAKDWADACDKLLKDPEYQDSEYEMYYFFARHLPKLFLKAYNFLLLMTVFSAIRKVQDEREKRQSEPEMKETLASHVREIEKEIYVMLEATSKGRPIGSTKSPEEKARASAEFEKQIEDAIQRLRAASGTLPTKTAVAKELGIGGLSPRTGTDSSLTSFNNKLNRLGIDYNEIVSRITD